MKLTLIAYLIALAISLVAIMIIDYRRGKVYLLSYRNLFFVGFILFQIISPILLLIYGTALRGVHLRNPLAAGIEFALVATAFLVLLHIFYHWGIGVRQLARYFYIPYVPSYETSLVLAGAVFVSLAFAMKLLVLNPVVWLLSKEIAAGLAAAGIGLLAIPTIRRSLNPLLLGTTALFLALAVLTAIMRDESRRPLIGVFLGGFWTIYYFAWRTLPIRSQIIRYTIVAVIPILFLAAYSTVRYIERGANPQQVVQRLTEADIQQGLLSLVSGSGTADVSFWLIENFPENYEYRTLNTLNYYLIYPIPRSIWPDKPTVLSQDFPKMAGQEGVPYGEYTVGTGIIGAIAAEGGILALFVYAAWIGLLLRFFDEMTLCNLYSPLGIAIVGAGLGQVIGLARGETGSFAALMTISFTGTLIIAIFWAVILTSFGLFHNNRRINLH